MARAYTKGNGLIGAAFACGGPTVTTRSRFMKAPDPFRDDDEIVDYEKQGKGGTMSKLEGDSKSKTPPTPKA